MSGSNLNPSQESEIQKLNQMSQQLRTLQSQHLQYKNQADELNKSIKMLKTFPEDKEIHRQVGQILYRDTVPKTLVDLEEKLELLTIRVNQYEKQFKDHEQKTKALSDKVKSFIQ